MRENDVHSAWARLRRVGVASQRRCRGGVAAASRRRHSDAGKFDEVTFFGLQYIIKRYLTGQVHRLTCTTTPKSVTAGRAQN